MPGSDGSQDRRCRRRGAAGPFAVLDGALAKTGWLVGGRFTVADINAAEIVRYAQAAPELSRPPPR